MSKYEITKGNAYLWGGLNSILGGGIRFLFILFLARILNPEDFGEIAIVMAVLWIADNITDGGFSTALIQKKTHNNDYETVFVVSIITSFVVGILIYVFASTLNKFLNFDNLVPLLKFSSIIPIIGSLGIVQKTILIKSINFKRLTSIGFYSNFLSGLLGLILANNGFGVWSYMYLLISFKLTETALLWKIVKWVPKLKFYKENFKEMFSFGSNMLISSLINSIFVNLYPLLIGKIYSPFTLGQFSQASKFKSVFSTDIVNVLDRVSFPILSKINNQQTELKATLKQILIFTTSITFTISIFIITASETFITLLLGEKWSYSIKYLQIISIEGIISPLQILNLKILLVKGKSNTFLRLEIVKKLLISLNLLIGYFNGIYTLLWGTVVISLISFFLNSYYTKHLINYSSIEQLKDCFKPFLISFIIGLSVISIYFLNLNGLITLGLQITLSFVLFIILNKKIQNNYYMIFLNYIKNIFK